MSWAHVSDRVVTSRKRHRCRVCWLNIEVGEQYLVRFGYDDDGPVTSRFHLDCEEYTAKFWVGSDSDAWESAPGQVSRREVREALGLTSEAEIQHPEHLP